MYQYDPNVTIYVKNNYYKKPVVPAAFAVAYTDFNLNLKED